MPMLLDAELHCDHEGCNAKAALKCAAASDGKLVDYRSGRVPGWVVGENPNLTRLLYVLCPVHNPGNGVKEALERVVASYKDKAVSLDALVSLQEEIKEALFVELALQKRAPGVDRSWLETLDIKIETDGSISVAFNDSRGALRPDSGDTNGYIDTDNR